MRRILLLALSFQVIAFSDHLLLEIMKKEQTYMEVENELETKCKTIGYTGVQGEFEYFCTSKLEVQYSKDERRLLEVEYEKYPIDFDKMEFIVKGYTLSEL